MSKLGKEINSTEIARLAGVSRSTVSRVINNYSNVPEHTKQKVLQVIEQYNYFPNLSAQVLAGKKTRTIGLFMIDSGDVSSDWIASLLLTKVIESASRYGYFVLTHIVRDPKRQEEARAVKECFYQRRIDGGIFIGAANEEPIVEELIAEGFMVAIVDHHMSGEQESNRIVFNFDNEAGAGLVIDYLAGLGHTRIGIINGDLNRYSGAARWKGFKAAMERNRLPIVKQWMMAADFNEPSGYLAIKELLKLGGELPTAIFAANDSIAFGAIRALGEAGLRVPDDLSIAGFDDHSLSAGYNPPLTTIHVDFSAMMDELTRHLIDGIENGSQDYTQLAMTNSLIVRESCRAPSSS
ncbi:LacI family DNA-binding transcriptional regulator [Paenibacillus sp. YIM B09110]|uniref:LacI family DNA-binding transcriptional regulator n=1 Tax=Paenibacillus sp. YIM B09110 TaxID=3126102 RepID=UPI00301DEE51